VLNGFSHFTLALVEVTHVAQSRTRASALAESALFYRLRVIEESLINLAKMLTDVSLHFQGLQIGAVL